MNSLKITEGLFYFSSKNEIYSGTVDKGFFICGFNPQDKTSFFYYKSHANHFREDAEFILNECKKRKLSPSQLQLKCILPLEWHDHSFFSDSGWDAVHLLDPQTIEKEFFFYVQTGRLWVKVLSQESYKKPDVELNARKIKVLIIDDSVTIHKLLQRLLSKSPDIEVVGAVSNPVETARAIRELKPDVLTVDIHMAPTDGVALLREILPQTPIPSLVVSSLSLQDGPFVLEALAAGAVDYIQKPTMDNLESFAHEMIEKIKTASTAKVKTAWTSSVPHRLDGALDQQTLVLMGASTGGTEALASILSQLPESIPPIIVVQHIPASFSSAFAARLNQMCPFEVREAKDGLRVESNIVYIAPGGLHTRLQKKGAHLTLQVYDAPPVNRHRPSVDVLFESVAALELERPVRALLLTGMGSDGAHGLLKLKKAGAFTAAQDKESCVVYGMPKVAVELGAADHVLPLEQIPMWLRSTLKKNRRAA